MPSAVYLGAREQSSDSFSTACGRTLIRRIHMATKKATKKLKKAKKIASTKTLMTPMKFDM